MGILETASEAHKFALINSQIARPNPWILFDKNFPVYNPSEFITNKGYRTIDQMRRDEQIKIAMRFKRHAILSTGWKIEQEDCDENITQFVEDTINGIKGTLEYKLEEIMLAFEYGFSLSEINYLRSQDGMIGIKDITSIKPHDIKFYQDKFGHVISIKQDTPDGEITLDQRKLILFSNLPEFGNVYGRSDLEAAYRAWWHKENSYRWLGMYLERLGIPPIFALYNPGPYGTAEIEQLKSTLLSIQAGTMGIIPRQRKDDLEMWSPQLASGVSQVFLPALDKFDIHISRAILMPAQLGMSPEESVGSMSRATVIFDIFLYMIESLRTTIEETVVQEQIVKPLVDLNFATKEYPKFSFIPIKDDVKSELFETWIKMASVGIVTPTDQDEEHIRKSFEFPELNEASKRRELVIQQDKEEEKDKEDEDKGEKKEDFSAVDQFVSKKKDPILNAENGFYGRLSIAALRYTDRVVGEIKMRGAIDANTADSINLEDIEKEIISAYTSSFDEAYLDGQQWLIREANVSAQSSFAFHDRLTGFVRDFLGQRALMYAKNIINGLRQVARETIIESILSGESIPETAARFIANYAGYWKGKPGMPLARAEMIARTEGTNAFAWGIIEQARQPDLAGILQGFRYSSVLDGVTSRVCTHLHNKLIKIDDPDLYRLKPANHYNCRSMLEPVLITDAVREDQWITEAEKREAFELGMSEFM